MPWKVEFFESQNLMKSHFEGLLTDEIIMEYQQSLRNHPQFSPSFNQLHVFEKVKANVTPEAIRFVAESGALDAKAKRAIVVDADLEFAFARMFEALRNSKGQERVQIFRSLEKATAWLEGEDE